MCILCPLASISIECKQKKHPSVSVQSQHALYEYVSACVHSWQLESCQVERRLVFSISQLLAKQLIKSLRTALIALTGHVHGFENMEKTMVAALDVSAVRCRPLKAQHSPHMPHILYIYGLNKQTREWIIFIYIASFAEKPSLRCIANTLSSYEGNVCLSSTL